MNSADALNGIHRPYAPLPTRAPSARNALGQTAIGTAGKSFADALQVATSSLGREGSVLKVSHHADMRLRERGVTLTSEDWMKLGTAVAGAEKKGAKDAYLCYGDVGLLVNIPNKTVVTAMNHHEDKIVTQVDSVVVVARLDR